MKQRFLKLIAKIFNVSIYDKNNFQTYGTNEAINIPTKTKDIIVLDCELEYDRAIFGIESYDHYIKTEMASKFVDEMIECNLIQLIISNPQPHTNFIKAKARIEVLKEIS